MSSVSRLNEYCQQNCLQNPEYNFATDSNLRWYCKVRVDNYSVVSDGASTKQISKDDAASKLIAKLSNRISVEELFSSCNANHVKVSSNSIKIYSVIYVIDLENRPFYSENINENILYLGFISTTHHTRRKYDWKVPKTDNLFTESKESNTLIFEIGGGVKELADHYMSTMSYTIVNYISHIEQPVKVVIKSCDNSGWCTNLCLKQIAKFRGLNHDLLSVENSS